MFAVRLEPLALPGVMVLKSVCACWKETPSRDVAELLVVGQVFEPQLAVEFRVEIARLVFQLNSAFGHGRPA